MNDEKKKEREMRRLIIENNLCKKYVPILGAIDIEKEMDILSISELIVIYNSAKSSKNESKSELKRLETLIYDRVKYGNMNFYIINENTLQPYGTDGYIYVYTLYDLLESRLMELKEKGMECSGDMILKHNALEIYLSFHHKGYHGIIVNENASNFKIDFNNLLIEDIAINETLSQNGYKLNDK